MFFSKASFGKGCSGTYYIKGIAFTNNKTILKNVELLVYFGDEVKTVTTDEKGHFDIEIKWSNACPSMLSKAQHDAQNAKRNPKTIFIKYNNTQVELENDWKKYARCFPKNKKQVTRKLDLNFYIKYNTTNL